MSIMSSLREPRVAFRRLRRRPGETLIAVAALALGIALTVTLFGVLHGSFLRSVPLPEPEELVGFEYGGLQEPAAGAWVPFPVFLAWREGQRSFDALAAFLPVDGNVSGAGGPAERYTMAFVSSDFFDLAGVGPRLGRGFRPEEERVGSPPVVVLSHNLWRERYGGDPEVLGRTVRIYGHPTLVVGVMPAGFRFPWAQDLWLPLGAWPGRRLEDLGVFVVGRLGEGVPLARARSDLARLDARLQQEMPEITEGRAGRPGSYRDVWFDRADRRDHALLLVVVAAVLLIACGNVASLWLARVVGRGRELALRTALGAGPARIMALPMLEAALVTAAAGIAGIALAGLGLDLYTRWAGNRTGAYWASAELSPPVVLFALGVIAVAGFAAGLLPAVYSLRGQWAEQLKGAAGGPLDRRTGRWQRLLVATQIGLCAALLTITALVIESLGNLEPAAASASEDVLTARVTLYGAEPPPPDVRAADWQELERRLRADPRTRETALSSALPGTRLRETRAALAERPAAPFPVRRVVVTESFFRVVGLPLVRGSGFDTAASQVDAAEVDAVVSRAFAERHFAGKESLGEALLLQPAAGEERRARIVGIAADLPMGPLEGADREVVYLPWTTQEAEVRAWVTLRAAGDPLALAAGLREAVAELAPDEAVTGLRTLDEALAEAAFTYRFSGALFVLFGVVALFLGALGLYAVMSFQVGGRTHEMGVRLAVGARRGDLLALVLRGGLWQVGMGLLPGLGLGMAFARLVTAFLYRVEGTGIPTLAVVAATLLATGLVACWLPARRAARTDPIAALRAE